MMYIKSKRISVRLLGKTHWFHWPNCLTCSKAIVNKEFAKEKKDAKTKKMVLNWLQMH